MKKIVFCLLFTAAIAQSVSAQDEHDALRFSFTPYQGTARGMGIGGAVGSLGADFSSLSINPAGIGIYRSSEFSFSPSFSTSMNSSRYLGSEASDNSSKFNFSHFGFVTTNSKNSLYKRTGWKTISFAVGMNRLATFKNEMTYTGKNYSSSLIERFAEDFNNMGGINANSLGSVNFSAYGAYQTYLIDRGMGADSNIAVSYVPYTDGIQQTKKVKETGGMQEYVISVGGNYMEKLMLGATLGITNLKYDRTTTFSEDDLSNKVTNDFKYFLLNENLSTEGTGVNLKLGAIFKPSKSFRLGLALHTPTHIELNDNSSIQIESHTDSLLLHSSPSGNPISKYTQDSALVFNYSLNTPYKAIVSATVLFGKSGFLSADAEYVDYSTMKYKYTSGFERAADAVNTVIKNTYKNTINIRVGAEAKLSDFSLRAGVAYYGSPYKNSNINASRTLISGGVGYRTRSWFLDATYIYGQQKTQEVPYIISRVNANVQTASTTNTTGNIVLTLGLKF